MYTFRRTGRGAPPAGPSCRGGPVLRRAVTVRRGAPSDTGDPRPCDDAARAIYRQQLARATTNQRRSGRWRPRPRTRTEGQRRQVTAVTPVLDWRREDGPFHERDVTAGTGEAFETFPVEWTTTNNRINGSDIGKRLVLKRPSHDFVTFLTLSHNVPMRRPVSIYISNAGNGSISTTQHCFHVSRAYPNSELQQQNKRSALFPLTTAKS